MADVQKLLLRKVVSEKQTITYRLLSRLVPCHVDVAKQHLFAFHSSDAARKAKVHATYLVAGTAKRRMGEKADPTIRDAQVNGNGHGKGHGDEMEIDATPPQPDSQLEVIRDEEYEETRIEVVDEEDLEDYKKELSPISCVHIYSLEPTRLPDITLLCPPNDLLHTDPKLVKVWEDSNMGEAFGLVKHPGVKMLGADAAIRQKPLTTSAKAPVKASTTEKKPSAGSSLKKESTGGASSTKKTEAPKKAESSIATMMMKQKAPVEKEEKKPAAAEKKTKDSPEVKKAAKKGKGKATTIIESDEEEDEDEDEFAADRRAAKAEEEAMMLDGGADDDDGVEVIETPKPSKKGKTKSESPVVSKKATADPAGEEGRKRVKKTRMVQKPKIVKEKDAKGYRVKREIMEEVEEEYTDWESDPDDAAAPSTQKQKKKAKAAKNGEGDAATEASGSGSTTKKRKSEVLATPAAEEKAKAGKPAASGAGSAGKKDGTLKKGAPGSQANIMSFFGKKG